MKKIPVSKPSITNDEILSALESLLSGNISSFGPNIELFEDAFASFCGVKNGAACSSGTAALHLSMLALGIKEGDEVIMPSFTMVATANAVKYCGGTPVFVDSLMSSWNMDYHQIESKITERTKAIIVVHTYGYPAQMDVINAIANKHNLYVVEDASEAHGALYSGERVGSLGDIACFSFYGNKIITTGEGGMVVSNDSKLIDKVKRYRNHCFGTPRFIHDEVGYNYRMTNIQASIGLAQLQRSKELIDARIRIGTQYNKELAGVRGVLLPPKPEFNTTNVFWMYGIVLCEGYKLSKDELMDYLYSKGVETRSFFYPMHLQPIFKQDPPEQLPISEYLYENGLYLPTFFDISNDDIKYISKLIINAGD